MSTGTTFCCCQFIIIIVIIIAIVVVVVTIDIIYYNMSFNSDDLIVHWDYIERDLMKMVKSYPWP